MPVACGPLLEALRRSQLLDAGQLQELVARVPGQADGTVLANAILRRGWLTPYQVRELVDGRVEDLALGEYVLLDVLGQGGMARVFKARHRRLNRLCALKVILPGRLQEPSQLARFHREAAAAALLDHPNIVRVYDAGECRGVPYLALEFIDGTDLARAIQRAAPLPAAAVCEWVREAALGLQHAHDHGLVHRDLKPSNLMLTRAGVVKILDLGLVQLAPVIPGGAVPDKLTTSGSFLGTAAYLAPEQALDPKGVDIRADLYSLGCTLFHLLTGQVPFPGDNLAATLLAHQQTVPPWVAVLRPDLPPDLSALVYRLLAKNPADRYQTPDQLARALTPFARGATVPPGVFAGTAPGSPADPEDPLTTALRPSDHQHLFPTVPMESASTLRLPSPPGLQRRPGRRVGMVAVGAVVCGLALAAVILLFRKPFDRAEPPPPDGGASPGANQGTGPGPGPVEIKPPGPALPAREFTNSVGMKLVLIPKGTFLMGSPAGEFRRKPNEAQHEVTITRPFYLGAYEVTQGQYQAVMGKNPSSFSREGEGKVYVRPFADDDLKRYPVENVSWDEAVEFCRLLSGRPEEKRLGRVYRLPTEAEWEYACRASTTTTFHFGDRLSSAEANFYGPEPYGGAPKGPYLSRTAPVGSYPPNAWGLYDMHGNVWEWCADWLDEGYYATSPREDPRGPDGGKQRCMRGGSWGNMGWDCRSACRGAFEPNKGYSIVGFRVVCVGGPPG
jgi:eukaryotic-like serine/threonine-protein kinase